jgi:hypothetical protein
MKDFTEIVNNLTESKDRYKLLWKRKCKENTQLLQDDEQMNKLLDEHEGRLRELEDLLERVLLHGDLGYRNEALYDEIVRTLKTK